MAAMAATMAPGMDPKRIREMVQKLQKAGRLAAEGIGADEECLVLSVEDTRRSGRVDHRTVASTGLAYHAEDITVVGGAVLTLLDDVLQDVRGRHTREIRSLYNELERQTPDIDLVWWPTIKETEDAMVVTSSSPCILAFVDRMRAAMEHEFPHADIHVRHASAIGVHSIVVEEFHQKVIDLSIHDSGTSQRYTINAGFIDGTPFMTTDPMYSSHTIPLYGGRVRIPVLHRFILQQIFAYDSFRRMMGKNHARMTERMEVSRRRIQYLVKWIRLLDMRGSAANQATFYSVTGIENLPRFLEEIRALLAAHHLPITAPLFSSSSAAIHEHDHIQEAKDAKDATATATVAVAAANKPLTHRLRPSVQMAEIDWMQQEPVTLPAIPSQSHEKKMASAAYRREYEQKLRQARAKEQEEKKAKEKEELDRKQHDLVMTYLSDLRRHRTAAKVEQLRGRYDQFTEDRARDDYSMYPMYLEYLYVTFGKMVNELKKLDAVREQEESYTPPNHKAITSSLLTALAFFRAIPVNDYADVADESMGEKIDQMFRLVIQLRKQVTRRSDVLIQKMMEGETLTAKQQSELIACMETLDDPTLVMNR